MPTAVLASIFAWTLPWFERLLIHRGWAIRLASDIYNDGIINEIGQRERVIAFLHRVFKLYVASQTVGSVKARRPRAIDEVFRTDDGQGRLWSVLLRLPDPPTNRGLALSTLECLSSDEQLSETTRARATTVAIQRAESAQALIMRATLSSTRVALFRSGKTPAELRADAIIGLMQSATSSREQVADALSAATTPELYSALKNRGWNALLSLRNTIDRFAGDPLGLSAIALSISLNPNDRDTIRKGVDALFRRKLPSLLDDSSSLIKELLQIDRSVLLSEISEMAETIAYPGESFDLFVAAIYVSLTAQNDLATLASLVVDPIPETVWSKYYMRIKSDLRLKYGLEDDETDRIGRLYLTSLQRVKVQPVR